MVYIKNIYTSDTFDSKFSVTQILYIDNILIGEMVDR